LASARHQIRGTIPLIRRAFSPAGGWLGRPVAPFPKWVVRAITYGAALFARRRSSGAVRGQFDRMEGLKEARTSNAEMAQVNGSGSHEVSRQPILDQIEGSTQRRFWLRKEEGPVDQKHLPEKAVREIRRGTLPRGPSSDRPGSRTRPARAPRPSPKYLHDWGRLQGTGGDSRGLDSWQKATSCQTVRTKVVHHQLVS
jgi:hypothetical protein